MNKFLQNIVLMIIVGSVTTVVYGREYPDSVMNKAQSETRIRSGWNFEFAGGVGMSQIAYHGWEQNVSDEHIQNEIGFPSVNANIGIGYYFLDWLGIATGIHFSTYMSNATIRGAWKYDLYDVYGDRYQQTITPVDVHEQQQIDMLEIPLALKFRFIPEEKKIGFIGALGVKMGIPIYNYYQTSPNGYFTNEVYYPDFDLCIQNIPTVIEDGVINQVSGKISDNNLRSISWAGYVEIGALIQLQRRLDLSISAFANYYFNDIAYATSRHDLGFLGCINKGEYPTPLHNEEYDGILNTNAVQALHPWNVGVKVGLQINASKTKSQRNYDKKQRENIRNLLTVEEDTTYQPKEDITVANEDTVDKWTAQCLETRQLIEQLAAECGWKIFDTITIYVHDTVYVRDTTVTLLQTDTKKAINQLDEMLSKAIIYFDLDKTDPILHPADILEQVAAMLVQHPNLQVYVCGHACILGKPAYNQKLSLKRANVVADSLISLGVNRNQLIIQAKGSAEPFRYKGEHQLSKDRRVEIVPVGVLEEKLPINEMPIAATNEMPIAATSEMPAATTEQVIDGSRLAQVARRHYGNPHFWVFIYEANKARVLNPNDIPTGITLVIPDLTERLSGMTETQANELAVQLEKEYLKK